MPSRLASVPRRTPQQERGQQRVAGLLHAAADVIAEAGYDAATMSEIAERAGACIGSLYQFFPNKEAITAALRAQYYEELRALWASFDEHQHLTVRATVKKLIDETIIFLEERPALLNLLESPCNAKDTSLRDLLRERLARILRMTDLHLSKTRAQVLAVVTLQLIKGMNELYAEARGAKRRSIVREYYELLTCYLRGGALKQKTLKRG